MKASSNRFLLSLQFDNNSEEAHRGAVTINISTHTQKQNKQNLDMYTDPMV